MKFVSISTIVNNIDIYLIITSFTSVDSFSIQWYYFNEQNKTK